MQVDIGLPRESGLRRRLRNANPLLKLILFTPLTLLARPFRATVSIPYGMCSDCDFLAPWYEISDDQLLDFYLDYLSPTYKSNRSKFEKGYRTISDEHGSRFEFELRQSEYSAFIDPYIQELSELHPGRRLKMLDFGGEIVGSSRTLN